HAPFPADQADQPRAVHERVAGEAPHGGGDLVFLLEVLGPEELACGGVEAAEVAHGAQGVDLAPADGRGAARAGGVADLVGAVVLVLPALLAGGRVEAEDALLALQPA